MASQFDLLESMFPAGYFTTESNTAAQAKWEENLRRLRGIKVKCSLIGEAPPWTEVGVVRYFYHNCDGAWVNRVWKAFFDVPKPADPEEALVQLANKGFLLVDSLPFAVSYSGRRNKTGYRQLVESCSSFLTEKINNVRIQWADDVKVALAFKVNGRAVIRSFPDGIRFPTGQVVQLTGELICADRSGYTSPKQLRSVCGDC